MSSRRGEAWLTPLGVASGMSGVCTPATSAASGVLSGPSPAAACQGVSAACAGCLATASAGAGERAAQGAALCPSAALAAPSAASETLCSDRVASLKALLTGRRPAMSTLLERKLSFSAPTPVTVAASKCFSYVGPAPIATCFVGCNILLCTFAHNAPRRASASRYYNNNERTDR